MTEQYKTPICDLLKEKDNLIEELLWQFGELGYKHVKIVFFMLKI